MAIVNTFNPPTASNLGQIDLSFMGDTTKYFNNFFTKTITISSAKDDAIVTYFEKLTNNSDSAMILASAVIYTSTAQGIDPMEVLDQFKKLEASKLNAYICYFLNLSRVGTSLIGVQNSYTNNKYITRTILA